MLRPIKLSFLFASLVSFSLAAYAPSSYGQDDSTTSTNADANSGGGDSDTLSNRGIAGYQDKKSRDPNLTVGTPRSGRNVKILADASIADGDYEEFPLKFEFYVNRHLISTQLRSPELPGAVGIDVTPEMATPPFNYAVIVTLLHPNSQYTSAIYGAVYPQTLAGTFSCELTLNPGLSSTSAETFSADAASTSQSTSSEFAISIPTAINSDDSNEISATGSLTVGKNNTISGTLDVTTENGTTSHSVSGTIDLTDNTLTKIEAKSKKGEVSLSCK